MNNETSNPSATEITPGSAYAWALHEQDIQDHDDRISHLEKQLRQFTTPQTATTVTRTQPQDFQDWIGEHRLFTTWTTQAAIENLLSNEIRQKSADEVPATSSMVSARASVPLWALLQFGSAVMLLTAFGSLAFWLLGSTPMLSPFVSLLTIVASPFTFLMGSAAKRG